MFPQISTKDTKPTGPNKSIATKRASSAFPKRYYNSPNRKLKLSAIDENGSLRNLNLEDKEPPPELSPSESRRKRARERAEKEKEEKNRGDKKERHVAFRQPKKLVPIERPELVKQYQAKKQISIFGSFARHFLDENEYLNPKSTFDPFINSPKKPPGALRSSKYINKRTILQVV